MCTKPITCDLRLISRKIQRYTFSCMLAGPAENLTVRLILNRRLGAVYHKFLIDIREDVCSYTSGKRKSILMDLVSLKIRNYTNFLSGCPYEVRFKDMKM